MAQERPESELARLRKEQDQTRHDEVFGGLSLAERTEYKGRADSKRRIPFWQLIEQAAS
jgi:hypothetical protein